jgi:two-component system sensor histidine kinase TctE
VTGERAAQASADRLISYEKEGEGPVMAMGQPTLAAELLGNLLDNAIRYSRPGGMVSVRLTNDARGPLVEIDDDGPGIPEAEREKVWDRFYRIQGRGQPTGTGLGLPIARALAQRMGAQIELADGRSGRGLCVTVRFLRAD